MDFGRYPWALESFHLELSRGFNLELSDGVVDFGRYPWVLESVILASSTFYVF